MIAHGLDVEYPTTIDTGMQHGPALAELTLPKMTRFQVYELDGDNLDRKLAGGLVSWDEARGIAAKHTNETGVPTVLIQHCFNDTRSVETFTALPPISGGAHAADDIARETRVSDGKSMVEQAERRAAAITANTSLMQSDVRAWTEACNDAEQALHSARFLASACTLTDSPLSCGFAEMHQLVEAVQELDAVRVPIPLSIYTYLLELKVLHAFPRSGRHKRYRVSWTHGEAVSDAGFETAGEARCYARNVTACGVADFASLFHVARRGVVLTLIDTYHDGTPVTREQKRAWA